MSQTFVAILMGSDSDLPVMKATLAVLNDLRVPYEVKITSAHRTPVETHDYVTDAELRGCKVFICAAGLAAHLAGVRRAGTLALDGVGALRTRASLRPAHHRCAGREPRAGDPQRLRCDRVSERRLRQRRRRGPA